MEGARLAPVTALDDAPLDAGAYRARAKAGAGGGEEGWRGGDGAGPLAVCPGSAHGARGVGSSNATGARELSMQPHLHT